MEKWVNFALIMTASQSEGGNNRGLMRKGAASLVIFWACFTLLMQDDVTRCPLDIYLEHQSNSEMTFWGVSRPKNVG